MTATVTGAGAARRHAGRHAMPFLVLLVALHLVPSVYAGDGVGDDVVTRARAAAAVGRRPEALAILDRHLAVSPADLDARLTYGLVLSWDGRYEDARLQLHQVLLEAPEYIDARVALMNVDWWSGHTEAARDGAEWILARQPGQPQARAILSQTAAGSLPFTVGITQSTDSFSDHRPAWHETAVSLTRHTSAGPVIGRFSRGERFDRTDRLVELEFYPQLRPGTYAFVGVGVSDASSFYPSWRVSGDLYHTLGRGTEISGGYRRINFDVPANVYVGAVSQYVGNWMFTGRVSLLPAQGPADSTSYQAGIRRYVRGDGVSYLGATYSHGIAREEIRDASDLARLGANSLRGDITQLIGGRFRLSGTAGTSRQERPFGPAMWQTTLSGGVTVDF